MKATRLWFRQASGLGYQAMVQATRLWFRLLGCGLGYQAMVQAIRLWYRLPGYGLGSGLGYDRGGPSLIYPTQRAPTLKCLH